MEGVPLRDARLLLISSVLALVSIGLLLSLLPPTSFVSRAADDIVDAVGPVWPEQSVEQGLAPGLAVVSEIRIWGAAGPGQGEAPVVAALLQGPDRELVRQVKVSIKASNFPQPHILGFAPYRPVSGEELILQLWVSTERSNHAIFGTNEPREGIAGPTINLNPTDQGPLAYELIWRGDGWRAALEGSWSDALRLAGGMAAAVLAASLHPSIARALRNAMRRAHAAAHVVIGPIGRTIRRARSGLAVHGQNTETPSRRRAFYVFPWLIPAFAILHYIANNLILIRAYESIVISVIIMVSVAIVYILLKLILRSSASAAVITGLLGMIFFAYGHIYIDREPPDDRFLLGVGVPAALGVVILLRERTDIASTVARVLNIGSVVLVVLPIYQLGLVLVAANSQQNRNDSALHEFPGLDERISEAREQIAPGDLRDIYYIILDQYPRSGSPESFDNSAFIQELEARGFYVDPYARSNYRLSTWSIASSMNMNYMGDDPSFETSQAELHLAYHTASNHSLGRIVKALGYKYVHVSSGWAITNTNANANSVVSFGPYGRSEAGSDTYRQCVIERIVRLPNRFTVGFLRTTALRGFAPADVRYEINSCPYEWEDPSYTLEWLEFMKEAAHVPGPKFVLAHLLKPHGPYSFDRYGNISLTLDGWDDDHDPTVGEAFYGQLIWLNARILEVIDAILAQYEEGPIIVIMGDHGYERGIGSPIANDILGAYLLPGGGDRAIYPSITSVNIFRSILNYYFRLDLEILDDVVRNF